MGKDMVEMPLRLMLGLGVLLEVRRRVAQDRVLLYEELVEARQLLDRLRFEFGVRGGGWVAGEWFACDED